MKKSEKWFLNRDNKNPNKMVYVSTKAKWLGISTLAFQNGCSWSPIDSIMLVFWSDM